MKLTNFNIQSVAIKSTKAVVIGDPSKGTLKTKQPIDKNIIIAKAIEWKHTQFKVEVDNKLYDVVCPDYKPEIIFSNSLNTYWEAHKPATTANRDTVDDLDIYWDYIYEGLEIPGTIKNDKFVIHNLSLTRIVWKIYNTYVKEQLAEAKYKKKNK